MKKIFFGALCAIALTSCHEEFATSLSNDQTAVIRMDRASFEHMKEGCTPYRTFYCEDC